MPACASGAGLHCLSAPSVQGGGRGEGLWEAGRRNMQEAFSPSFHFCPSPSVVFLWDRGAIMNKRINRRCDSPLQRLCKYLPSRNSADYRALLPLSPYNAGGGEVCAGTRHAWWHAQPPPRQRTHLPCCAPVSSPTPPHLADGPPPLSSPYGISDDRRRHVLDS